MLARLQQLGALILTYMTRGCRDKVCGGGPPYGKPYVILSLAVGDGRVHLR